MTKYWQENPNHYAEWGEKGGLPIEPLTIRRPLDVIGLLVDQNQKAITDEVGNFILIGNITIIYGGAGKTPVNQQERQRERELPASSPAFESVLDYTDTSNLSRALIYVDGSGNWFASLTPLGAGYTIGYISEVGGDYFASTVSGPNDKVVRIYAGNVVVEP